MHKLFVRLVAEVLIPALVWNPSFAGGLAFTPTAPLTIPSRFGIVTDFCASSKQRASKLGTGGPGSPLAARSSALVVLIQDFHANTGVQRNIAEILKYLASGKQQAVSRNGFPLTARGSLLTVFVEGASGPFDVSILRNVRDRKLKRQAIEHFLGLAELSGAEIAAIESKRPMHLWGIDDKDLYIRNLLAFAAAHKKSPSPLPQNPAWKTYYSLAEERNIPLSLNTLSHLDLLGRTAAPPQVVAMVVGGYHAKGLTEFFKAQKVPYEVVTPNVANLGEEHIYTDRLESLAQYMPEKHLAIVMGLAVGSFIAAYHTFILAHITTYLTQQAPVAHGSMMHAGVSAILGVITAAFMVLSTLMSDLKSPENKEAVTMRVEKGVATITLRAPKLHALTIDHIKTLEKIVDEANNRDDVKSIVFEGADGNFCAGADIAELLRLRVSGKSEDQKKADAFFAAEKELHDKIRASKKRTITIASGITMGGGLGIAFATNHIITTDTSEIAMPETKIGFVPDVGATRELPQRMGVASAKYYGLTGAVMNGKEAVGFGLAHTYVGGNLNGFLEGLAKLSSEKKGAQKISEEEIHSLIREVGGKTKHELEDEVSAKKSWIEKYFNFGQHNQGYLGDIYAALKKGSNEADAAEMEFARNALASLRSNSSQAVWVAEFFIDTFAKPGYDREKARDIELKLSIEMSKTFPFMEGVLGFMKYKKELRGPRLDQIVISDHVPHYKGYKLFRQFIPALPTPTGSRLDNDVVIKFRDEEYILPAGDYPAGQDFIELRSKTAPDDESKKLKFKIAMSNSQWSDQQVADDLNEVRTLNETWMGWDVVRIATLTNLEKFELDEVYRYPWKVRPKVALDMKNHPQIIRYPGGKINPVKAMFDEARRKDIMDKRFVFDIGEEQRHGKNVEERPISYVELEKRANQMANVLKYRLGVQPGDQVVIYQSSRVEALIAELAVTLCGASYHAMFAAKGEDILGPTLYRMGAKFILTEDGYQQPGKPARQQKKDFVDAVMKNYMPSEEIKRRLAVALPPPDQRNEEENKLVGAIEERLKPKFTDDREGLRQLIESTFEEHRKATLLKVLGPELEKQVLAELEKLKAKNRNASLAWKKADLDRKYFDHYKEVIARSLFKLAYRDAEATVTEGVVADFTLTAYEAILNHWDRIERNAMARGISKSQLDRLHSGALSRVHPEQADGMNADRDMQAEWLAYAEANRSDLLFTVCMPDIAEEPAQQFAFLLDRWDDIRKNAGNDIASVHRRRLKEHLQLMTLHDGIFIKEPQGVDENKVIEEYAHARNIHVEGLETIQRFQAAVQKVQTALDVPYQRDEKILVYERLGPLGLSEATLNPESDVTWSQALKETEAMFARENQNLPEKDWKNIDQFDAVDMDGSEAAFMVYSSGTTGQPKPIVHTVGGVLAGAYDALVYSLALAEYMMHHTATDIGWIVSTLITWFPLLLGRSVTFQGFQFTPERVLQVVQEYGMAFAKQGAPQTQLMANVDGIFDRFDISSLNREGNAGIMGCAAPFPHPTYLFLSNLLGKDMISNDVWQSEDEGPQGTTYRRRPSVEKASVAKYADVLKGLTEVPAEEVVKGYRTPIEINKEHPDILFHPWLTPVIFDEVEDFNGKPLPSPQPIWTPLQPGHLTQAGHHLHRKPWLGKDRDGVRGPMEPDYDLTKRKYFDHNAKYVFPGRSEEPLTVEFYGDAAFWTEFGTDHPFFGHLREVGDPLTWGKFYASGRTGNNAKVSGNFASDTGYEDVLNGQPGVRKAAATFKKHPIKGQTPILVIALKEGVEPSEDWIQRHVINPIRTKLNPQLTPEPEDIILLPALAGGYEPKKETFLPFTRTGKIMYGFIQYFARQDLETLKLMQEELAVPNVRNAIREGKVEAFFSLRDKRPGKETGKGGEKELLFKGIPDFQGLDSAGSLLYLIDRIIVAREGEKAEGASYDPESPASPVYDNIPEHLIKRLGTPPLNPWDNVPPYEEAWGLERNQQGMDMSHLDPLYGFRKFIRPTPTAEGGKVVVQILYAGATFNAINGITRDPVDVLGDKDQHVFGDAAVAQVLSLSPEAEQEGRLQVGQLVIVDPMIFNRNSPTLSISVKRDGEIGGYQIGGDESTFQAIAAYDPGNLIEIPRDMYLSEAATLILNGPTVEHAFNKLNLQPDDVLLIHGATRGTGSMAIDMAAANPDLKILAYVETEAKKQAVLAEHPNVKDRIHFIIRSEHREALEPAPVGDPVKLLEWQKAVDRLVASIPPEYRPTKVMEHAGAPLTAVDLRLLKPGRHGSRITWFSGAYGLYGTYNGYDAQIPAHDLLGPDGVDVHAGQYVLIHYGANDDGTGHDPLALDAIVEAGRRGGHVAVLAETTEQLKWLLSKPSAEIKKYYGIRVVSVEDEKTKGLDWPDHSPDPDEGRFDPKIRPEAHQSWPGAIKYETFKTRTISRIKSALKPYNQNPDGLWDVIWDSGKRDHLALNITLAQKQTGWVAYGQTSKDQVLTARLSEGWMFERSFILPADPKALTLPSPKESMIQLLGSHMYEPHEAAAFRDKLDRKIYELHNNVETVDESELPAALSRQSKSQQKGTATAFRMVGEGLDDVSSERELMLRRGTQIVYEGEYVRLLLNEVAPGRAVATVEFRLKDFPERDRSNTARNQGLNWFKGNAVKELENIIKKVQDEPSIMNIVKSIVITAESTRAFVPGQNTDELAKLDDEQVAELAAHAQATFEEIEQLHVPVILNLSGLALGGGNELVAAAHYVVASNLDRIVLGQPESYINLIPGFGGTQRLIRILADKSKAGQKAGLLFAADTVLTGQPMTVAEAYHHGLVSEMVPSDSIRRAYELAKEQALWDPATNSENKPVLQRAMEERQQQLKLWEAPLIDKETGKPMDPKTLTEDPYIKLYMEQAEKVGNRKDVYETILKLVVDNISHPYGVRYGDEAYHFGRLSTDPASRKAIMRFRNRVPLPRPVRRPVMAQTGLAIRLGVLKAQKDALDSEMRKVEGWIRSIIENKTVLSIFIAVAIGAISYAIGHGGVAGHGAHAAAHETLMWLAPIFHAPPAEVADRVIQTAGLAPRSLSSWLLVLTTLLAPLALNFSFYIEALEFRAQRAQVIADVQAAMEGAFESTKKAFPPQLNIERGAFTAILFGNYMEGMPVDSLDLKIVYKPLETYPYDYVNEVPITAQGIADWFQAAVRDQLRMKLQGGQPRYTTINVDVRAGWDLESTLNILRGKPDSGKEFVQISGDGKTVQVLPREVAPNPPATVDHALPDDTNPKGTLMLSGMRLSNAQGWLMDMVVRSMFDPQRIQDELKIELPDQKPVSASLLTPEEVAQLEGSISESYETASLPGALSGSRWIEWFVPVKDASNLDVGGPQPLKANLNLAETLRMHGRNIKVVRVPDRVIERRDVRILGHGNDILFARANERSGQNEIKLYGKVVHGNRNYEFDSHRMELLYQSPIVQSQMKHLADIEMTSFQEMLNSWDWPVYFTMLEESNELLTPFVPQGLPNELKPLYAMMQQLIPELKKFHRSFEKKEQRHIPEDLSKILKSVLMRRPDDLASRVSRFYKGQVYWSKKFLRPWLLGNLLHQRRDTAGHEIYHSEHPEATEPEVQLLYPTIGTIRWLVGRYRSDYQRFDNETLETKPPLQRLVLTKLRDLQDEAATGNWRSYETGLPRGVAVSESAFWEHALKDIPVKNPKVQAEQLTGYFQRIMVGLKVPSSLHPKSEPSEDRQLADFYGGLIQQVNQDNWNPRAVQPPWLQRVKTLNPPQSFIGLWATVTGGGKALGKAITLALAGVLSMNIVITGRDKLPLEQTVGEIEGTGSHGELLTGDVSDQAHIQELHSKHTDAMLGVNNAGVAGEVTALPDIKLEDSVVVKGGKEQIINGWTSTMAINFKGPAYDLLEVFSNAKRGYINFNISSIYHNLYRFFRLNYIEPKNFTANLTPLWAPWAKRLRDITLVDIQPKLLQGNRYDGVVPGMTGKFEDYGVLPEEEIFNTYLNAMVPERGHVPTNEEVADKIVDIARDPDAYVGAFVSPGQWTDTNIQSQEKLKKLIQDPIRYVNAEQKFTSHRLDGQNILVTILGDDEYSIASKLAGDLIALGANVEIYHQSPTLASTEQDNAALFARVSEKCPITGVIQLTGTPDLKARFNEDYMQALKGKKVNRQMFGAKLDRFVDFYATPQMLIARDASKWLEEGKGTFIALNVHPHPGDALKDPASNGNGEAYLLEQGMEQIVRTFSAEQEHLPKLRGLKVYQIQPDEKVDQETIAQAAVSLLSSGKPASLTPSSSISRRGTWSAATSLALAGLMSGYVLPYFLMGSYHPWMAEAGIVSAFYMGTLALLISAFKWHWVRMLIKGPHPLIDYFKVLPNDHQTEFLSVIWPEHGKASRLVVNKARMRWYPPWLQSTLLYGFLTATHEYIHLHWPQFYPRNWLYKIQNEIPAYLVQVSPVIAGYGISSALGLSGWIPGGILSAMIWFVFLVSQIRVANKSVQTFLMRQERVTPPPAILGPSRFPQGPADPRVDITKANSKYEGLIYQAGDFFSQSNGNLTPEAQSLQTVLMAAEAERPKPGWERLWIFLQRPLSYLVPIKNPLPFDVPVLVHVVPDLPARSRRFIDYTGNIHLVFDEKFIETLLKAAEDPNTRPAITYLLATRLNRDHARRGLLPTRDQEFRQAMNGTLRDLEQHKMLVRQPELRKQIEDFFETPEGQSLNWPFKEYMRQMDTWLNEKDIHKQLHLVEEYTALTYRYNYVQYPRERLAGEVVVITGGGSGIGQTIAEECVKEGAHVVITGRTDEKLKKAISGLLAIIALLSGTNRAIGLTGDVRDETSVAQVHANVENDLGREDTLVNNAGESGPVQYHYHKDYGEYKKNIDIHITGTWQNTVEALKRGVRKVITVTTYFTEENARDQRPYDARSDYTSAQGMKNRLMELMALENPDKVFIATNPGPVHSDRIYKSVYPKKAAERILNETLVIDHPLIFAARDIVINMGDQGFDREKEVADAVSAIAQKRGLDPNEHAADTLALREKINVFADNIYKLARDIQKSTENMIVDKRFLKQDEVAKEVVMLATELGDRHNGQVVPIGSLNYPTVNHTGIPAFKMEHLPDLNNHTTVVTVGYALSEADLERLNAILTPILQSGSRVVFLSPASSLEKIQALAAQLPAGKLGVEVIECNLVDEPAIQAGFQQVVQKYGKPNIVIHATGDVDYSKRVTDMSRSEWDNLVKNFEFTTGAVVKTAEGAMAPEALTVDPRLFRKANGSIILIGPSLPVGNTSAVERARVELFRGGLRPNTATFNQELRILKSKIRINLILPGRPDGKFAKLDNTAATALYLASDDSKDYSGNMWYVDEMMANLKVPSLPARTSLSEGAAFVFMPGGHDAPAKFKEELLETGGGSASFTGLPGSAIRIALQHAATLIRREQFVPARKILVLLYPALEGFINRPGGKSPEEYMKGITFLLQSIGFPNYADFPAEDVPLALNEIVKLIKKLPDAADLLRTLTSKPDTESGLSKSLGLMAVGATLALIFANTPQTTFGDVAFFASVLSLFLIPSVRSAVSRMFAPWILPKDPRNPPSDPSGRVKEEGRLHNFFSSAA